LRGFGRQIHMVGIGGEGMSGLASILLKRGACVSGSDLKRNQHTERLSRVGAVVHASHAACHVRADHDCVIVSSAIRPDNEEVLAAERLGIPVIHRLHALSAVIGGRRSIGVAGTHGKTTVTAMSATILRELAEDPSFLIGAHCETLGGNACDGRGDWFVAEIDESDGLFTCIRPTIAVLNNIGKDHLQTYRTVEDIDAAFRQYVKGARHAVLEIDDPRVYAISETTWGGFTVGFHPRARLRATHVRYAGFRTSFTLELDGRSVTRVTLPAPGRHNVKNALCALGAAAVAGMDLRAACRALGSFGLPHRRFELLEENGVTVVDDYAHLPEEVAASLYAVRTGWPGRRIVAVFQPHRYTRTQTLGREFAASFDLADVAVVTDIYPASEAPIQGVSASAVADAVACASRVEAHWIPEKADVTAFLKASIQPGDFIISFGAGDVWQITRELSEFLIAGNFQFASTGEPICSR